MPERPAAAGISGIMDQLSALRGRLVRFQGMECRLVDVVDTPPMVVLQRLHGEGAIHTDSYGHPVTLGPGFIDVPVFAPDGELSPEFRMILLPGRSGEETLGDQGA